MSPSCRPSRSFLLLVHVFGLIRGQLITLAPRLPSPHHKQARDLDLFGDVPNNWLGRRDETNCDGVGTFRCPAGYGTCYTGGGGYIGCCTESSCAARTTCIDAGGVAPANCDFNFGGCISCSGAVSRFCVTETNVKENQYILYCNSVKTIITHSYDNLVTSSVAASTTPTTSSSKPTTPSSSGPTTTPTTSNRSSVAGSPTTGSPNPNPTNNNGDEPVPSSKKKLGTGAIVGIAIGALVGVAAAIFAVYWFFIRKLRDSSDAHAASATGAAAAAGPGPALGPAPETATYSGVNAAPIAAAGGAAAAGAAFYRPAEQPGVSELATNPNDRKHLSGVSEVEGSVPGSEPSRYSNNGIAPNAYPQYSELAGSGQPAYGAAVSSQPQAYPYPQTSPPQQYNSNFANYGPEYGVPPLDQQPEYNPNNQYRR